MAYSNFKPTIWSKFIQTELERKCRLVEYCNTQFEGEAKLGGTVHILGVNSPEVYDYDQVNGLNAPQQPEDHKVSLLIDQAKAFNFKVDDVDKAQSVNGLMETLMKEATAKMATVRDAHVAKVAARLEEPESDLEGYQSASTAVNSEKIAKKLVDEALVALRERDVDLEDNVIITLSPFFYNWFKNDLTELKTNNDELIRKGVIGMYDNCLVQLSNNLYNDGTDDYMMVRTKKAIAFASAIDQVEAYRPENFFADAVKGLNVYGAKVVRPKELQIIKAHK